MCVRGVVLPMAVADMSSEEQYYCNDRTGERARAWNSERERGGRGREIERKEEGETRT